MLDTERVYTEVTQEILDKYANGARFTWEVKSKLMGRTGREVLWIDSNKKGTFMWGRGTKHTRHSSRLPWLWMNINYQ